MQSFGQIPGFSDLDIHYTGLDTWIPYARRMSHFYLLTGPEDREPNSLLQEQNASFNPGIETATL